MTITHQTVVDNLGKPAAALIPWSEFLLSQEILERGKSPLRKLPLSVKPKLTVSVATASRIVQHRCVSLHPILKTPIVPAPRAFATFAPCMFVPPSISNNPPPVSSENGSLNSSEEDTGGGLHSGLTWVRMHSRSGRFTGPQPREPRSRKDRFAPGAFEPVAEHWVSGSVSGFNLEPLTES